LGTRGTEKIQLITLCAAAQLLNVEYRMAPTIDLTPLLRELAELKTY
jgi:hypothetical protein